MLCRRCRYFVTLYTGENLSTSETAMWISVKKSYFLEIFSLLNLYEKKIVMYIYIYTHQHGKSVLEPLVHIRWADPPGLSRVDLRFSGWMHPQWFRYTHWHLPPAASVFSCIHGVSLATENSVGSICLLSWFMVINAASAWWLQDSLPMSTCITSLHILSQPASMSHHI